MDDQQAESAPANLRIGEAAAPAVRVLHVLDHSVPMQSGYSFRTLGILREQRRRGWQTFQLTTPRHTVAGPDPEQVDGFSFHRTPPGAVRPAVPGLRELLEMRATAARRR